MEIDNCLISYFVKLNTKFQENFINTIQDFDEEVIHDLRVSIKKIRAYFLFQESLDKDFNAKKAYLQFKDIFKKSGVIRDLQVQKNFINEIHLKFDLKITYYLAGMEQEESVAKSNFNNFFHTVDLIKFIQIQEECAEALKNIPKNVIKKETQGYIKELLISIFKLTKKKAIKEKHLHKLRKLLKELFYNLRLINECIFKNEITQLTIKSMDELQESLGKWHDSYVALENIHNFINKIRQDYYKNTSLEMLEKELNKTKDKYLKEIEKRFKEFATHKDELVI